MLPVSNEEDGYDIHHEVDHIMAGIDFAPAPVDDSAFLKMSLRKHMCMAFGMLWMTASVDEHTLPSGERAFTISRRCKTCHTIHTQVALYDGVNFIFVPIRGE